MTEDKKESIEADAIDETAVEMEESGGSSPENGDPDKIQPEIGDVGVEDISIAAEEADQDVVETEEIQNIQDSQDGEDTPPASWNIDLLLDVELPVRVSFGQTEMPLRDVFKLGAGSVIELDKSVNDPVAVIVNNKTIAKGEVVMVDGNYGVRILEVESTADRIRSLG